MKCFGIRLEFGKLYVHSLRLRPKGLSPSQNPKYWRHVPRVRVKFRRGSEICVSGSAGCCVMAGREQYLVYYTSRKISARFVHVRSSPRLGIAILYMCMWLPRGLVRGHASALQCEWLGTKAASIFIAAANQNKVRRTEQSKGSTGTIRH
jgi:hypothetical protein